MTEQDQRDHDAIMVALDPISIIRDRLLHRLGSKAVDTLNAVMMASDRYRDELSGVDSLLNAIESGYFGRNVDIELHQDNGRIRVHLWYGDRLVVGGIDWFNNHVVKL